MARFMLAAAAVGAALTLAPPASAAPYNQLVVFGDSFSDTGNAAAAISGVAPSPPYFGNRFSNGPNYIDRIGAGLKLPSTASLQGGTDYAFAAATTSVTQPSPLGMQAVPSLAAQVATYLASVKGVANPNALYIVQGGTNDVLGGLLTLKGTNGTGAAATLDAIAKTGAANIAGIEGQLAAAGGRNFLTVSLPDLALLPITRASGFSGLANEAALAGTAAATFNAAVLTDLGTAPAGVTRSLLDLYALTDGIMAGPAGYGITNVTGSCTSGIGLFAAPVTCTAAEQDTFLFFDTIHLTGRGNAAIAVAGLAALPVGVPAPGPTAALLGLGLTVLLRSRLQRPGFLHRQAGMA